MATYECSECGMAVNATCAKCDAPLVNDLLKLEDGSEVQVSKCPNDHGKIKSHSCCFLETQNISYFECSKKHQNAILRASMICVLIEILQKVDLQ